MDSRININLQVIKWLERDIEHLKNRAGDGNRTRKFKLGLQSSALIHSATPA